MTARAVTSPARGCLRRPDFTRRTAQAPTCFRYVSNGTSHDQLLGREALRNYIYACGELGVRTPTLLKAVQFLRKNFSLPSVPTEGCRNGGSLLKKCRRPPAHQPPSPACSRHGMGCSQYSGICGGRTQVSRFPAQVRGYGKQRHQDRMEHGVLINLYAALGDGTPQRTDVHHAEALHQPNLFDLHPVPDRRELRLFLRRGRMPDPRAGSCRTGSRLSCWLRPGRRLEEGVSHGIAQTRGGLKVDLSWQNGRVQAAASPLRVRANSRFMHQGLKRKKDFVHE